MGSVSDQIKALTLQLEEELSKRIVEIAMDIRSELVDNPPIGTPIDTGWASNNWWFGVGASPAGNGGVPPADPIAAATDVAVRASGFAEGLAQLGEYRLTDALPIYVSNHVPYINRLNSGWSQQTPSGFIEMAIANVYIKYLRK
ncbi:hypothetical protein HDG34_005873 [Paraburkholderia sp. HC6.4b]|uniref:hypothetical protein n=1 Tax=unclassified Paraburkholderia TaxID=2615204 RepID=UPI00161065AA|nr:MULTISPECIES: hypothetical protein [unclassified Paraburkholderia]MBB5411907.1 hypothetical protein [Paraburkholderia sp. HC6.4b]MBB5450219.1 hypothetical protein [Paraburkholderia sp. Kb1A]